MDFRQWLAEVGMGGGGAGSGMTPPLQRPDTAALSDYHGPEGADPRNQNGKLPPTKAKKKK